MQNSTKNIHSLRLLSLATALIIACSACNKTPIEEVGFPKQVELLVGQYCFPQVVLDDYEYSYGHELYEFSFGGTSNSASIVYHNREKTTYTFSDWVSSNQDVAMEKGDTIFALAQGACEMTAVYQDRFGEHSVSCYVTVSDLDIPTAEDTIFIQYGVTTTFCKFDIPGLYPVNYELIYENGIGTYSKLNINPKNNDDSSSIRLSTIYTYYLVVPDYQNIPEQGLVAIHIFCEPLGIDVTIPIVMLPSGENKGL